MSFQYPSIPGPATLVVAFACASISWGCESNSSPPEAGAPMAKPPVMEEALPAAPAPVLREGDFNENLFRPEPIEGVEEWSWPSVDDFRAIWEESLSQTRAARLVAGEIVFTPREDCPGEVMGLEDSLLGYYEAEKGTRFFLIYAPQSGERRQDWKERQAWSRVFEANFESFEPLSSLNPARGARYETSCGVLTIEAELVSPEIPIHRRDREDRIYATTLLTFTGPLYDEYETPEETEACYAQNVEAKTQPSCLEISREAFEEGDAEARRAAIDRLFEDALPGRHRLWRQAYELAGEWEDEELLYRIHRRFRPVGRCSLDSFPQTVASNYAELCASRGELGCFLQLRRGIMSNSFDRRSFSSLGRDSHQPDTSELAHAPVDPVRFLRGMWLLYPRDTHENVDISSVYAGDIAAKEAHWFIEPLIAMAQDGDLDAYNRLRATQSLHRLAQLSIEHGAVLEKLDLDETSRFWLAQVER